MTCMVRFHSWCKHNPCKYWTFKNNSIISAFTVKTMFFCCSCYCRSWYSLVENDWMSSVSHLVHVCSKRVTRRWAELQYVICRSCVSLDEMYSSSQAKKYFFFCVSGCCYSLSSLCFCEYRSRFSTKSLLFRLNNNSRCTSRSGHKAFECRFSRRTTWPFLFRLYSAVPHDHFRLTHFSLPLCDVTDRGSKMIYSIPSLPLLPPCYSLALSSVLTESQLGPNG